MERRKQPQWNAPTPSEPVLLPELKLFNSLTSQKEIFVPAMGKKIRWYICGPTVYDLSHMGHARTYIAFDALRRVLSDYFLFDVVYVLNITDVDDKIIKRARQNHLITEYVKKDMNLVDLYDDISKAIRILREKSVGDPDPDKREYLRKEVNRLIDLLGSKPPNGEDPVTYLVAQARDAIAEILDREYGASVTDHKIFEALSRRFEDEYHKDMEALSVMKPDVLVRVTEFIDPIIKFVQRIVENGFGYAAPSGSVYFETNKFANDPKHFYGKLVPTAYGDTEQLATGEGELAVGGEKRSPNDFALWKASKQGEPAWPSPWGPGRPGWHIECSVMASTILGDAMEIHSGGVDLRFPHHDNELAQAEAYFGHSHWVHYFLHSGHLTISGCKMSKSLKNFITIRDGLKTHSARRLRLTFLLHSWRDTMDYSQDTLAEAISYEKTFVDFLYNASNLHLLAQRLLPLNQRSSSAKEQPLFIHLKKAQQEVYDAFCDSLDIRRALAVLKEFVGVADQFALNISDTKMDLAHLANQVYWAASFALRVLRILGIAEPTLASEGTPVPANAIVAGGKPPLDLRPVQLDSEDIHCPPNMLQRSWLSLDTLTVDRVANALYATLMATQSLANALIDEGDLFADLVKGLVNEVYKDFNVDLFGVPESPTDCLSTVVETVSKRSLSELLKKSFGLETEVWPIVFDLMVRLVLLRQSTRTKLLTAPGTDKAQKLRVLTACDRMRDKDLAVAGVRLQDRASATDLTNGIALPPSLGLVDAAIIAEEIGEKTKKSNEKKAQKDESAEKAGRQHPSELFRSQPDKYSAFDDKGMPTHDVNGNELSKSQLKKLKKLYDAQAKRHESFLKVNGSNGKER